MEHLRSLGLGNLLFTCCFLILVCGFVGIMARVGVR